MEKLIKSTLYYYCLPDRFKKQISSYSLEVQQEDEKNIYYRDPNGYNSLVHKENLNLTVFKGSIDADYSIVFENISEELNMDKVEKVLLDDASDYLQALATFARKETR